MTFFQSTQQTSWMFTKEKLDSIHARWNAYAKEKVSRGKKPILPKQTMVVIGGNDQAVATNSASVQDDLESAASANKWLSPHDEKLLLLWCELRILDLCRGMGFHRALTSSAVTYFKRFYTRASALDYPPHEMITACIFLAIKTESCPFSEVDNYIHKLALCQPRFIEECVNMIGAACPSGEDAASSAAPLALFSGAKNYSSVAFYLQYETPLLTALKFQLVCHHPYMYAKGVLTECIQSYIDYLEAPVASSVPTPAYPLAFDTLFPQNISTLVPPPPLAVLVPDTSPDFSKEWDAIQSKLFASIPISLLSSSPLVLTPLQSILACFLFAVLPLSQPLVAPLDAFLADCRTNTESSGADSLSSSLDTSSNMSDFFVHLLTPAITPIHSGLAWYVCYWLQQKLLTQPLPSGVTLLETSMNSDQIEVDSAPVVSAQLEREKLWNNLHFGVSDMNEAIARITQRLDGAADPSGKPVFILKHQVGELLYRALYCNKETRDTAASYDALLRQYQAYQAKKRQNPA